jgi:hypothetical protein
LINNRNISVCRFILFFLLHSRTLSVWLACQVTHYILYQAFQLPWAAIYEEKDRESVILHQSYGLNFERRKGLLHIYIYTYLALSCKFEALQVHQKMAQMVGTDEIESLRVELAEIGRSIRSSFRRQTSSFRSSSGLSSTKGDADADQDALQWAAIERLPTFERLRSSLFDKDHDDADGTDNKGKQVIDVSKLGDVEQHVFIEKLIKHIEHDNLLLLQKIRNRIDK